LLTSTCSFPSSPITGDATNFRLDGNAVGRAGAGDTADDPVFPAFAASIMTRTPRQQRRKKTMTAHKAPNISPKPQRNADASPETRCLGIGGGGMKTYVGC
jgi:hypothetical protein